MRAGWSGLVSRIQDGGWLEPVETVDLGHEDGAATHFGDPNKEQCQWQMGW